MCKWEKQKEGSCRYGESCKFKHKEKDPGRQNIETMEKNEKNIEVVIQRIIEEKLKNMQQTMRTENFWMARQGDDPTLLKKKTKTKKPQKTGKGQNVEKQKKNN